MYIHTHTYTHTHTHTQSRRLQKQLERLQSRVAQQRDSITRLKAENLEVHTLKVCEENSVWWEA